MRQSQREEGQRDGDASREVELNRGLLALQEREGDSPANPSHRRPELDPGEGRLGVVEVTEGERVPEGEGGGVEGAIEDEGRVEGEEGVEAGEQAEGDAPEQGQGSQHFLRREITIGDQSDEERGDHRPDGKGPVGGPDLLPAEFQGVGEIGAHADVPASPDEVLQEVEEGEFDLELRLHDRK